MDYFEDADVWAKITLDELRELAVQEGIFARHLFAYLFPGRPSSIAERMLRLEERMEDIMSGFDDIKQAVADVATAVSDVATALKNHPTVDNDPALKSMAIQLEGAAHTLESIANPPAPVVQPAPASGGAPDPASGGAPSPSPSPAPATGGATGAGDPPPPPPAAA